MAEEQMRLFCNILVKTAVNDLSVL